MALSPLLVPGSQRMTRVDDEKTTVKNIAIPKQPAVVMPCFLEAASSARRMEVGWRLVLHFVVCYQPILALREKERQAVDGVASVVQSQGRVEDERRCGPEAGMGDAGA